MILVISTKIFLVLGIEARKQYKMITFKKFLSSINTLTR
ncbi:hypothetical protein BN135_3170 [Cronobacter muytjensii 530]